jgi:hypothetical protein
MYLNNSNNPNNNQNNPNNPNNNYINQDEIYDLEKRLNSNINENENENEFDYQNQNQNHAINIIKNYIEKGLIKEDCYLFENFDFRSEISYCVFCDNNVYLIDKRLIICAGNCFYFTVNPNIMKLITLDEIVSLLTKMIKEHKNCKEEIIFFEDDYTGMSFFCSNTNH